MTEDKVKKAAQDMIALVEGDPWFRRANWPAGEGANILDTTQFQALKASLTPSREEIADYLEKKMRCITNINLDDTDRCFLDLAIAELRKGDVK